MLNLRRTIFAVVLFVMLACGTFVSAQPDAASWTVASPEGM